MLTDADGRKIREAGLKAIANRKKGYHCSESVFLAINDTFHLVDPSMVRMVTGFHGGGGSHATKTGIDLTALLEEMASGRETRSPEELPITQVKHLCGALASGVVCIGLIYGRERGTDDLSCVDELCFELHRRFEARLGARECGNLVSIWKPLSATNNCEHVYETAAEIAVELILEAPRLFPACANLKKFRFGAP